MSAGGNVILRAEILDLAKIVFSHQIAHRFPEIVFHLGDLALAVAVQSQQGNQRRDVIAAACLEFFDKIIRPGQTGVGHRVQEYAHQRRLIGECGFKVFAQIVTETLGIVFISHPCEFVSSVLAEQIDIGSVLVQVRLRVSSFIKRVMSNDGDSVSGMDKGFELAVGDARCQVDRVFHVGNVSFHGNGQSAQDLAGRNIEFHDLILVIIAVISEQTFGFPFRILAQDQSAGISGGVSFFIVKPEISAFLFGLGNSPVERVPMDIAFHVLVKMDIADNAAETFMTQKILADAVLLFKCIRPVVDDFQDLSLGRRFHELFFQFIQGCFRGLFRIADITGSGDQSRHT